MTIPTDSGATNRRCAGAMLVALALPALLGACSVLKPSEAAPPRFYALGPLTPFSAPTTVPTPTAPLADAAPLNRRPTLLVLAPRAAAGFDSQRIIYLRQAHQIEYFAHNEWVDTPARMLHGLLVDGLARNGAFAAVTPASGAAGGDVRLDTEIVRLQQEFTTQPSRVRFTLRAALVDDRSRRVLAWREFDSEVPATSDDPYGGVAAANAAVQQTLEQLAQFSAQAAAQWQAPR